MPLIAAVGELSYNGYTFDGASHVTVNTEFVKDDAERTILYHKITISVKTTVFVNPSTDQTLESIRAALGEQGKRLTFTNQGFGDDLDVNAGGWMRDVKWGPKPQVLAWEPIGSALACEVEWECVTCIPMCDSPGNTRIRGLMALNYTAEYTIDTRGYTTRTITGYLEIAQTRNGKLVPDSADQYRTAIAPFVPVGFKRESTWRNSLDKSRLDFSITDTEIGSPNAFPPAVVNIEARHRVRWAVGRDGKFLRNSLSVDIEMAANQQASTAFAIFMAIFRQRIAVSLQNTQAVLVEDYSMEENIFGRDSGYSASWRILSALRDILTTTGLWTPLGTDWQQWHFSMTDAHSQRGFSKLGLLPANDAIVDMCGANPGTIPWNTQQATLEARAPQRPGVIKNVKPKAENSWLGYNCYVMAERTRPVVRQSVLQAYDTDISSYQPNSTSGPDYGAKQGTDDILQQGGRSRYTYHLIGNAQRVGYEIPRPVLTSVGPSAAVETNNRFVQRITTNALGVPIYSANWVISYDLVNSPARVGYLPNVKEEVDSNGNAVQPR